MSHWHPALTHFLISKLTAWLVEWLRWLSVYLASVNPFVQTPVPPKKQNNNNKKKQSEMNFGD
jgi:hypothetical protein